MYNVKSLLNASNELAEGFNVTPHENFYSLTWTLEGTKDEVDLKKKNNLRETEGGWYNVITAVFCITTENLMWEILIICCICVYGSGSSGSSGTNWAKRL